ncbi:MAG: hypothetical protein LHV69_05605 [Elusimicrobia bacterium]|nr:hypothetical protein [Candidatus Obscuribacterium magneticum]
MKAIKHILFKTLKISLVFFPFIAVSIAARADPIENMASRLAKGARSLQSKKVAVLSFPYHDGRVSSGSSLISEQLTTSLVGRRGIQVVERRLIQKLLEEKRLAETGVIDKDTAKTMGSLLGVDAIVSGTLIELKDEKTEINARMIKAETGDVISAAMTVIKTTWMDKPKFPDVRVKKENVKNKDTTSFQGGPPSPSPAKTLKPSLRLSNDNFPPHKRSALPYRVPDNGKESQYEEEEGYWPSPTGNDDEQNEIGRTPQLPEKESRKTFIDKRLEKSTERINDHYRR